MKRMNKINKQVFIDEVKVIFKYMYLVFFIGISARLIQTIYYDGWESISLLNVLTWYLILALSVLFLSNLIVFFYSEKIRE